MSELPLEAYYDLTEIGTVAVSPEGDRVAFTATEYDQSADEQVTSLFVVPRDGSRDPHRLTSVSGASSPKWGPDGDRLAFLAARDEAADRRVGWQDRDDDTDEDSAGGDDGNGTGDDDNGTGGDGSANGDNGDDEEPKTQVWLFDLALGGDAEQVTTFEEGVSEFDWSPDGDRVVVAARDPTDEQEAYLEQVREGGPIETTRLQHKLDGVGWTDDVRNYLFVVEVASGDERRLDDAYGGGAMEDLSGMDPAWGPDGRIAFTAYRGENPDDTTARDVYLIDPDDGDAGGDAVRLTAGDLACNAPAWSDDGRVGFLGGDPVNWCIPTQVYVGDPSESNAGSGADSRFASITADLDRTVARGGAVHWVDGDVYTQIADHSRTRLVRASPDGDVDRVFEAQGNQRAIGSVDVSDDGSTAAFVLSDPDDGSDVYAVDVADLDDVSTETVDEAVASDGPTAGDETAAAGETDAGVGSVPPHHPHDEEFPAEPGSITRLSNVNEGLIEEFSMPAVERVTWESDGWEIDGVVYHDPDVDPRAGAHPLVVAIHGGPISYDEPVFSFAHAALTSRGYVVLRPNYRGGSSRGRAFSEELHGQWGTAEVADITAGVEELVERGWVDPDRVFGYGFSYGGITQGFLVTREPDLLTAAVPEHGLYDLRSAFGTDDSHNWMENEYGLPWENPDAIDASTAVLDAGEIETPLLVTAGGEDWRCPPSQSEQLYVSAKKVGVDAKLVVYPDEHHNVGDPDRAIHRLSEIVAWYEKHDPAVDADADADAGTAGE